MENQPSIQESSPKPEQGKLRSIGQKLTETGNKLLEYSSREAETKDLVPALSIAALLHLSLAVGLTGHADKVMEIAEKMTLIERLTNPGVNSRLVDKAITLQALSTLSMGLAIIELATAMVGTTGTKLEEFNKKIGFIPENVPVSTHVYPAAARALIFAGNVLKA